MSPSSPSGTAAGGRQQGPDDRSGAGLAGTRYGRYVALAGLVVLAAIALNAVLRPHSGATGIPAGEQAPPFAAPLALGGLPGDINFATHSDDGPAGKRPACDVRGARILNICELYEHAPVVLALFVDGGSCPAVLNDMQALAPSFPQVHFAAVAIKGQAGAVGALIRSHGLTFPVGLDRDGSLVSLYGVATCPQLSFLYPGGIVQSPALLSRPSRAQLRTRVAALVQASRARGRQGQGT